MWQEGEEEWEYSGGNELVQGTLYAYIELSQWSPSLCMIKKIKKFLNATNKQTRIEAIIWKKPQTSN
jgi:hypothetical protein